MTDVKKLTVAEVMTKNVLKARPAMPLKEVARVLATRRVSALRCSTLTTAWSAWCPSATC